MTIDIRFFEEKELSIYLKKLFQKLKDKLNLNVYGYYDVTMERINEKNPIVSGECGTSDITFYRDAIEKVLNEEASITNNRSVLY